MEVLLLLQLLLVVLLLCLIDVLLLLCLLELLMLASVSNGAGAAAAAAVSVMTTTPLHLTSTQPPGGSAVQVNPNDIFAFLLCLNKSQVWLSSLKYLQNATHSMLDLF